MKKLKRKLRRPIKILKKLIGSVQFDFGFISNKSKKPNWIHTEKYRAKPGKTEPRPEKQAKTVCTGFVLKNQTEPNQNWSVWTDFDSVLILKKKN